MILISSIHLCLFEKEHYVLEVIVMSQYYLHIFSVQSLIYT